MHSAQRQIPPGIRQSTPCNAIGADRVRARREGEDPRRGDRKDTSGGLGQLEAMCAHEQVLGCVEVSKVYERGLGDVEAEPGKSGEYLKRACDLHDDASCARRRLEKAVDLTSTSAGRFNAMLRDQCQAGKMKSCELFGRYAIDGNEMPKDLAMGAEYLAKACRGGRRRGVGWGEDEG